MLSTANNIVYYITDVTVAVVFERLVFVVVRTSDGLSGLGEGGPMHPAVFAHFVNTVLSPICLGRDPLQIDPLWFDMLEQTQALGVSGVQPQAIAGVDLALWDILGKVTGLPVSVFLGGRHRESVQVYASLGVGAAGHSR